MFLSNPVLPINENSQNQTVSWWGVDDEKSYDNNLKEHGNHLSNECFQNITYTFNEYGYRTEPFKLIDWNNSILMFGCSMCFGAGLKYEHTIGEQLSTLVDSPIINLGINGGSPYVQMLNSNLLLTYFQKNNIYPKAVIYLWPSLDRFPMFDNRIIYNMGPWSLNHNADHKQFMKYFSTNDNMKIHNQFAIQLCINFLWKDIPVISGSFFKETATLLGKEILYNKDFARDMIHPGPISAKAAANYLANQLNLSS
tara:strand:- start:1559 stop:2320 length:762 start_codon:yes stop_codon:yes gene_type:complete